MSIKNIKKGLINVTSNVLSAPAQYKAHKAHKQANSDVATIKRARAYDNASNTNRDGSPSDAFKARSAADAVKRRLQK